MRPRTRYRPGRRHPLTATDGLSEIQFLCRKYVKDDCIKLPNAKTRGRVVPLGPEARVVLTNLPQEDDNP